MHSCSLRSNEDVRLSQFDLPGTQYDDPSIASRKPPIARTSGQKPAEAGDNRNPKHRSSVTHGVTSSPSRLAPVRGRRPVSSGVSVESVRLPSRSRPPESSNDRRRTSRGARRNWTLGSVGQGTPLSNRVRRGGRRPATCRPSAAGASHRVRGRRSVSPCRAIRGASLAPTGRWRPALPLTGVRHRQAEHGPR